MKLKLIKSAYSDGTPFIELQEPLLLADVVFIERRLQADIEALVNKDKFVFKDKFTIEILIKPNDNIHIELSELGIDLTEYNEYAQKTFKPVFNGCKTPEQRRAKIEAVKIEAENYSTDKMKDALVKRLNNLLVRDINASNEKYRDEMTSLFTNRTQNQKTWDTIFEGDEKRLELTNKVKEALNLFNEARKAIKEAEKELNTYENNVIIEMKLFNNIEPSLKEKLLEKLNSGENRNSVITSIVF